MTLYEHWKALTTGNSNPWVTEPSTDTQYRVTEKDDTVYVDFQACGSKKDWFMAFWFWKKRFHTLRGHAGWVTKATSIEEAIVTRLSGTPKKIVFRGYSNGAAIAFLMYSYFRPYVALGKVFLVAFATPRVFSKRNLRKINMDNCTFVKHAGDIVTILPPRLFCYGNVEHQIIGTAKCYAPKYHSDKLYEKALKELC